MSKRNRKVQPMVVSSQPSVLVDDPLDRETMEKVQEHHLRFLDNYLLQFPRFRDIPVTVALAYDLIQILNNQYLSEHLSQ